MSGRSSRKHLARWQGILAALAVVIALGFIPARAVWLVVAGLEAQATTLECGPSLRIAPSKVGAGRTMHKVRMGFTTSSGEHVEISNVERSCSIGKSVRVLYDPRDPGSAVVTSMDGLDVLMLLIGLVFILAGTAWIQSRESSSGAVFEGITKMRTSTPRR